VLRYADAPMRRCGDAAMRTTVRRSLRTRVMREWRVPYLVDSDGTASLSKRLSTAATPVDFAEEWDPWRLTMRRC